jgi:anti-sigma factor ChrR (cupin superfamily)
MTISRAERDAAHNAELPEGRTVRTSTAQWVDWGPGIQMQLLRATPETGHWSCLFKCAAGSCFGRHEHLGAGEFLVLKGKVVVRGGEENGGMTSIAGDYVYEPNGVIHDANSFPEESLIYFSNDGPLKFLDDDDHVVFICDWRAVRDVDLAANTRKDPKKDRKIA